MKWIAVGLLLASAQVQAWDCAYDREFETELDLSDASELKVTAVAGELRIVGKPNIDEARIEARVCVSEEEWLDEVELDTSGGERASIAVITPDTDGWNFMGSRYAAVDLVIEIPERLDLVVQDSSGDLEIEGVSAIRLRDSSGDIRIENTRGPVELEDSSGDIEVIDLQGDLLVISDSSGDMEGRGISGSVRVQKDSSGSIRFYDVDGDVIVEKDSSGDIRVDNVQGNFTVLRDGSGSIRSDRVGGEIDIPANKG